MMRRWRAGASRRRAALDHRHHTDCRLCLHRRLAAHGARARKHRLAQHLLCLGSRAYRARTSHQLLHDSGSARRQGSGRQCREATRPDRSCHDPARLHLRRRMDRHRRDGRAFPRIMEAAGATPSRRLRPARIGPAQVAARIVEPAFSRFHPLVSTRLATITHPIGAVIVAILAARRRACSLSFHGSATAFSPSRAARRRFDLRLAELCLSPGLLGAPSRMARPPAGVRP